MKDYIGREAACELLAMALDDDWEPEYAADRMNEIPAADVQPVVRGQWIWEENEWQYRCSACRITCDYDKTYELFDHGYQYANFCPNCGAEMRG